MNGGLLQFTWTEQTAMQLDRLAPALAALESLGALTVTVTIRTGGEEAPASTNTPVVTADDKPDLTFVYDNRAPDVAPFVAPAFDLAALGSDVACWWRKNEQGETTWRRTPRHARLDMVRAVIRQMMQDGVPPSQHEFDRQRPVWMPRGGTHPTTFGCTWEDLCNLDVAIPLNAARDA